MSAMLGLVFLVSIGAGFIDAIAGGGGLILLPTLLFTGLPPAAAIATNKLFNVASSASSAIRYFRAGVIRWQLFGWMIGPALIGAILGSRLIGLLSRQAAEPLIAILLIGVALIVLLRPSFGNFVSKSDAPEKNPLSASEAALLSTAGFAIGIHDGFFGPGAGIFLIFALIHFGRSTFLGATSTAKVVNLLTSGIALAAFIHAGQVNWLYGLVGSVGVMIGSNIGAKHAELRGSRLIRPVFLFMAVAISIRLVL